jgi:hypothetical protein
MKPWSSSEYQRQLDQIKNATSTSLFYSACIEGDVERVKKMIKSLNLFVIVDGLVCASELGHIDIVKIILEDEKMIQYKKDDIKSYTDILKRIQILI